MSASRSRVGQLVLSLLIGSAGCGSEGAGDAPDADSDAASEQDATSDVALSDGADDAPYFGGERYLLERSHATVIRRITFAGELEPGVAYGFDLDGRTSPSGDRASCGHGDLRGPDGEEGIDNQFAKVWGLVEALVGTQVEELLQGAINEGRVLIVVEVAGVDDPRNAEAATINVYRALLHPQVGTMGMIAPDQTYYYDYDNPISTIEGVRIVDGAFEAGPFEIQLPIQILELDIVATMVGGRLRVTLADDGTMAGVIGGAFDVPEMIGAILETPAAAEARLVQPFFENNADMEPGENGKCRYLSLALLFESTTAFVVRDAASER